MKTDEKLEEIIEDDDSVVTVSRKKPLWKKTISVVVAVAVIICAVFIVYNFQQKKKDDNRVKTISTSTLSKALEINDLSTLDYTYNGIAEVKNSDDEVAYNVAYNGTITAGIDFSKIEINVDDKDENNKKITIKIPDPTIQSTSVDMGSMSFIFTDDDYDTETVSEEAYKHCIEDLKNKAPGEKGMLGIAKENAKNSVEALINPWVNQLDKSYKVEIK